MTTTYTTTTTNEEHPMAASDDQFDLRALIQTVSDSGMDGIADTATMVNEVLRRIPKKHYKEALTQALPTMIGSVVVTADVSREPAPRRTGDLAQLYEQVRNTVRLNPGRTDRDIAEQLVAEATPTVGEAAAISAIEEWCWDTRRKDQIAVERAAQQRWEANVATRQRQEEAAERARLTGSRSRFDDLFADPTLMYHPIDSEIARSGKAILLTARDDREAFYVWCLKSGGDARFREWHQRAAAIVAGLDDPAASDMFEDDWDPDGPGAAARRRAFREVFDLIDRTAETVRLELTADLMSSEFALGDGQRVTWGSASAAEHEQRITMLAKNAAANVETAARHRSAVNKLVAAGCDRLGELPEVADSVREHAHA